MNFSFYFSAETEFWSLWFYCYDWIVPFFSTCRRGRRLRAKRHSTL